MDEIAPELTGENEHKANLLKALLKQSNVIITSRPHVSLPAGVRPPDLELETIGFYLVQVKEYLKATFKDEPKRVEDVEPYFQAHQLIQCLVRIPILLDALCYSWDNFDGKAVPQTMTAIYKAVEENLWKKDILQLGKDDNGELLTQDNIKDEDMSEIENHTDGEIRLLEGLAFTGLCNDVINFGKAYRKAIYNLYKPGYKRRLLGDKKLPQLSFLRTSDPSLKDANQEYHFLHLTFEEYFAARYFVRQWKAKQPLSNLRRTSTTCSQ